MSKTHLEIKVGAKIASIATKHNGTESFGVYIKNKGNQVQIRKL